MHLPRALVQLMQKHHNNCNIRSFGPDRNIWKYRITLLQFLYHGVLLPYTLPNFRQALLKCFLLPSWRVYINSNKVAPLNDSFIYLWYNRKVMLIQTPQNHATLSPNWMGGLRLSIITLYYCIVPVIGADTLYYRICALVLLIGSFQRWYWLYCLIFEH